MPPSVSRVIGVEEGHIFNVFDFQTFKATVDFTPRRRIDEDGTVLYKKGFVGLDGACIEKMEKLALLQWDGGGEAKEGATDGRSKLKMAGDVERLT
jgi:hypothetical protein